VCVCVQYIVIEVRYFGS